MKRLIGHLLCTFGKHKMRLRKNLTKNYVKRYKCARCGQKYTSIDFLKERAAVMSDQYVSRYNRDRSAALSSEWRLACQEQLKRSRNRGN